MAHSIAGHCRRLRDGAGAAAGHPVWKDGFTSTLSHELAETISDPDGHGIHVIPPGALPASLRGDDQIGDNEPAAQRYGYRLNGDWVQPYWSDADKALMSRWSNARSV